MAARRNRDESRDNSPIMSVTRNTWTTQRTGKSCCRRHPSAWGRPRTRVIGARQRGRRLFFGAALFSAVWVVRLRRTEMLHKENLLLRISSLPRIFAADIFDGQMALQKPQQKSWDSHGLFAKRNSLKYQKSQIPGLASQISWVLRNRLWLFSVPLSRTGQAQLQRCTNTQSRSKSPTNILTFPSIKRERLPQLKIGEFRRKCVPAEVSELPIVHAAFSMTERGRLSNSSARTIGKLSTANRYFEHISVKGLTTRFPDRLHRN